MNKYKEKIKIDWKDRKKSSQEIIREMGPYLNLGWQLAITMGLCTALGYWLDKEYSLYPVLTVVLSIFGAIAGLVNFIRTVLKESKRQKRK